MRNRKRGEMYIDTVISLIITLVMLYVIISLFSVLYTYEKINGLSNNLVSYMAARGEITSADVGDRYTELLDAYGLKDTDVQLSYDGSRTIDGIEGGAVQFGDLIKLNVQYTKRIGYMNNEGFLSVPISITKVSTSQNYWKIPE